MKVSLLQEPELEFGEGTHIDIKFGLLNLKPLDGTMPQSPKEIKLGLVGSNDAIDGLSEWINRCESGVEAKKSPKPNLFPRFPGFGSGKILPAKLITDESLSRVIPNSVFKKCYRTTAYR